MNGVDPAPRVAVIGAASATDEEYAIARAVGRALGEAGAVLICGGRGGVMEGAARGCVEAGGLTVGILPGTEADARNPWIQVPLATGLGEARNALVVGAAEAAIAVGGAWGTLSEIALARKRGLAVCSLGTPPAQGLGLRSFEDPVAAVEWALESARETRGRG